MNKNVRFGMELEHLRGSCVFKDICDFLRGKTKDCYYFDRLKPLFDEYGYKITINSIMAIWRMTEGAKTEEAEDNKGETEHE